MSGPVSIPYFKLDSYVLGRIVEEFVLREGTDYGDVAYSLEEKKAHVMRQLEKGDAEVVFDPETESCNIVTTTSRKRKNSTD